MFDVFEQLLHLMLSYRSGISYSYTMNKKISVFDYTDYRQYLAEYYEEQKRNFPKVFSYRFFAQKAGYNSSGLYKDIVSKRTNIKPGFAMKLSKAIGHSPNEEEYFECMVNFNQAETVDEKNKYFERMKRFYRSKAFIVDAKQHEFYSKWYYSAVRDLLSIGNFADNYSDIARSLNPRIRSEQAKKSIQLLCKLGLIEKNGQGYYKAINRIITSGDEVGSLQMKNFQSEMIGLARDALDRFPAHLRNISTVTFSISKQDYSVVNAEIDACRKKILQLVEKSKNEDRLYQLNLQLFPLSQIRE